MDLEPGTWGCSHGSGAIGGLIRWAERGMTRSARYPLGDVTASWAGHCFVYIGRHNFGTAMNPIWEPAIVEAEYPKAVISPARKHPDAIWATGQPLTPAQRAKGVAAVRHLVGRGYDWPSYGWFALRTFQVAVSRDLAPLFTDPHWIICSGVVVVEQEAMGVDISPLKTAATESPDFVSPADALRWGLDNGWMDRRPRLVP